MKTCYIQRAPFETSGVSPNWAAENGHTPAQSLTCGDNKRESAFPFPESFDWRIVMSRAGKKVQGNLQC
jgi:hypothetical protein